MKKNTCKDCRFFCVDSEKTKQEHPHTHELANCWVDHPTLANRGVVTVSPNRIACGEFEPDNATDLVETIKCNSEESIGSAHYCKNIKLSQPMQKDDQGKHFQDYHCVECGDLHIVLNPCADFSAHMTSDTHTDIEIDDNDMTDEFFLLFENAEKSDLN